MSHEALNEEQFHEHWMVEGKQESPFRRGRMVPSSKGPFHSKEEAVDAMSGLTKPQLRYYKPGTLSHS